MPFVFCLKSSASAIVIGGKLALDQHTAGYHQERFLEGGATSRCGAVTYSEVYPQTVHTWASQGTQCWRVFVPGIRTPSSQVWQMTRLPPHSGQGLGVRGVVWSLIGVLRLCACAMLDSQVSSHTQYSIACPQLEQIAREVEIVLVRSAGK